MDTMMTDFDYDEYETTLNGLRDECLLNALTPQGLIEKHIDCCQSSTLKAMSLCCEFSTLAEQRQAESLLITGLFKRIPRSDRIAALLLSMEVGRQIQRRDLEKRFVRYKSEQPLFTRFPKLDGRARKEELLPCDNPASIRSDGIVELEGGYARLDPMLPPAIVHTLAQQFREAPLYIRLDPEFAENSLPSQLLLEAIMVPARHLWWRDLGLRHREQTGAQYSLIPPASPRDDAAAYVEYHVKGFRKLETITQRKDPDHLTMMLEELQLLRNGMLIGRCIHLDTKAPYGTPPDRATVLHVDLAINVYTDAKVDARLMSQMNDAEKVEASFRTHLLRTEEVPFDVLIPLSFMFFGSDLLKLDLFTNQFSR
ncbi:hypothetical protein RugamoR57_43430 [Duganella caerulea]|uniref:hypothetical protein n=1 Tax=Duganella caerulea TaxID=2885762 RepID=UPI0030EAB0E9